MKPLAKLAAKENSQIDIPYLAKPAILTEENKEIKKTDQIFATYDYAKMIKYPSRYGEAMIYFWDRFKNEVVGKVVIVDKLDVPAIEKTLQSNRERAESDGKLSSKAISEIGIKVYDQDYFNRLEFKAFKGQPSDSFKVPAVFGERRIDPLPIPKPKNTEVDLSKMPFIDDDKDI